MAGLDPAIHDFFWHAHYLKSSGFNSIGWPCGVRPAA
jgi:hypothetical protein